MSESSIGSDRRLGGCAPLDAGSSEHLRRHTRLAPRRVIDAFSTPVLRRSINKSTLETGNVLATISRSEAVFDALSLLDQVEALEWIGLAQFRLDLLQLTLEEIGAGTTAATAVIRNTARAIGMWRSTVSSARA